MTVCRNEDAYLKFLLPILVENYLKKKILVKINEVNILKNV